MRYIQTLFLLAIIGFTINTKAQNAPIIKLDTVATTASTAVVAIAVKDFNNIKSFDLRITYDPLVAKPINVLKGAGLKGSLTYDLNTVGVIKLIWNAPVATEASLNNGADLLNISFNKVGVGNSSLNFNESNDLYDCQFYNNDGALYDLPAENYFVSGLLTFSEQQSPVTHAPVVIATVGADIDVPIIVTDFNNIGAVSLTLSYDTTVLSFNSGINTGNFPDLLINQSTRGTIKIAGYSSEEEGYSLADSAAFITLNYTYMGGTTALSWFDDGESCEYNSPITENYSVLNDTPQSSYYINGSVSSAATLPSLAVGTITNPTTCGGSGSIALNFINVPDGTYTITHHTGSFSNVAVLANTASIPALAGIYNNLQIAVNGQTSKLGVSATINDPEQPTAVITNNTGTTVLTCSTTLIEVTASGGESYSWSDGSNEVGTEASLSISTPGIYTVTVTGSTGCTATEFITINKDETVPTAVITNNTGTTVLTCSTTLIEVTASGGESYSWSDGSNEVGTEASLLISTPGTYTVTVTGSTGCTATEFITISKDETVPTAVITNNTGTTVLTCSTTLIEVTASGGESYSWSDGSNEVGTEASLSVTSPGIYTVIVTGSGGCAVSNFIVINEDISEPIIEIINNSGNTVLTGTDTTISVTATGGVDYLWFEGLNAIGSEADLLIRNAGTYTVIAKGVNGCEASESITINKDTVKTGIDYVNSECLLQMKCYPNPFYNSLKINYRLPEIGYVSMEVVDITGNLIKVQPSQKQMVGEHTLSLDGTKLVPGIYMISLRFKSLIGTELLKTVRVIKK